MAEKINIKKSLRVFNTILAKGDKQENEYTLNGLSASTDFDGYTATLRNDYARLDIYFHNTFSFSYTNNKEKLLFLEKIDLIDRQTY